MMRNKKEVLRRCLITKQSFPKEELFRIVKNKENKIFLDETHKANGRGAYLKKDLSVINLAKDRKILSKEFKFNVDPSIYNELIEKIQ